MDRRRFLTLGAGAVGTGLVGPGMLRLPTAAADTTGGQPAQLASDAQLATQAGPTAEGTATGGTQGFADIAVGRGAPGDAVRKALEGIGGMGRFVRGGQVVVIKPNAGFVAPPEWGATTHPEVLTAVIEECLAAGARRVLVADHTLAQAERCFARTGIGAAVARIPKAKLVSLDDEQAYTAVEIPRGESLRATQIASMILKADVLINLPSAKVHSATRVSLGLKNLMGAVWDRGVFHSDMDIEVGIADLATVLRPHLTIIDAIKILQTNGPAGPGEVGDFGGVVAGVDPVAIDAYGVGLSTWDHQTLTPEQVGHIRHAAARGVGTLDLASLKIVERS
jgi:uncharacterized protein (DUF362 family)